MIGGLLLTKICFSAANVCDVSGVRSTPDVSIRDPVGIVAAMS